MNFLTFFFLSGKVFILSLILNDSLDVCPCFSSLWVFHVIPFWPEMFLLRNQLTVLWVTNSLCLAALKVLFNFKLCHFNYRISWCVLLWVPLVWDSLCFLDLCVCVCVFLHQVREVFSHYFFKQDFDPLVTLFSFWCPYYVVSEVP